MFGKHARVTQYRKISVLLLDVAGEEHILLLPARCLGAVPGVSVHVVASSPWSPVRFLRSVRSFRAVPGGSDEEAWIGILMAEARRVRADVLLPVEEGGIRLIRRHTAELEAVCSLTPIPSLDALDHAGDKWLLSRILHQCGLPTPQTLLYDDHEQFVRSLDLLKFPVLLKPLGWWGGRGTRRFDNRALLCDFLERNRHLAGYYLAQEFVAGRDAGCNILCHNGEILAYTMQRGYLPPTFPFGSPAGVEFFEDPNVLQSVARLAKALSWNGVANIDLRVEEPDGSLHILEVNPRFWRTLMGSLAAGVNFLYLACLHGMGESVKQLPYKPIRFIAGNNVALKRRMRWHSREEMLDKVEERSSLEYVMHDPMPEVFMILRAALGRRPPTSVRNREWEMRLGTEADNP